ncbi:MAG TPA: Rieske 2Fe-2S domain-containing protein [Gemmataceae bacterium]|nr:Rieske 2Fe-2S domain-containing protein [Gemmataceae bacterium]
MIPSAPSQRTAAPDGRPAADQPAWRQDFPVDAPQDQYLTRRGFTRFVMLASAVFGLGQLGLAVCNLFRGRRAPSPTQPIARVAEIPVGSVRWFHCADAGGPCLLLRPAPDAIVAFSQKCTHLGCAVTPDADGKRLRCPCHEGLFDAATGRPLAGPPRRPLPRVALQLRDGVIHAVGVDEQPL